MRNTVNISTAIKVRCHFCSKEREPWRIHRLGENAQFICDYCVEHHIAASAFLAGGPIPGCSVCGATWELLRDANPTTVEVRLYVVPCDGVLAVLCAACLPPYVAKRSDLYRGTPFGTNTLNL